MKEKKVDNNQNQSPNGNGASPVVSISKHACERAKERLNWNASVLDKMAEKAFAVVH